MAEKDRRSLVCRLCGDPIAPDAHRFGSDQYGWEHMAGECADEIRRSPVEPRRGCLRRACSDVTDEWRFPRRDRGYGHWLVFRYRVANRQWTSGVNRIMGHRIGWFVVLGNWSYGICKPLSPGVRRERDARNLR